MKTSRTAVLLLATGCLFFTGVATSSYSLFSSALQNDYQWSRAAATLPFTVAMIFWGVISPVTGKLLDDYGARPVILTGILTMALGFAVMGLARSMATLLLGYGVLVGLAYGASGMTVFSILISKHYPPELRARAVGFSQIASPANPLLMAPLVYWLISGYNWHAAAFAISALLLLFAFPMAWLGARDPQDEAQSRVKRPGLKENLNFFLNPSLQRLMFARFACGMGFFLIAHLLPLATSKGLSSSAGAAAVSVYGGSAVLGALLAGRAADRYGRGRVLGLTYFIRGLGCLGLAFLVFNNWSFYLLVALAAGPIFGTITVNNVAIFEIVGPRAAGTILGLSFVLHQVAASISPYLGGVLFDLSGTYQWFLVVLGLFNFCAGLLTYSVRTESRAAAPYQKASSPNV